MVRPPGRTLGSGSVPAVTFKGLCVDAAEAARVARFWGAVLALDVEIMDGGDAVLRDDGRATIWVNGVPEPKAAKNRVHLDLHVPADRALLDLGATPLGDQDGFRVYADPEGNEFCAFPGPGPAAVALCTDSAEPEPLARWWADLTGAAVGPGPDGVPRYLHDVPGLGPLTWKFVPVTDPRTAKNRWHWDVFAHVPDLVAAGATVLRARDDAIGWTILADPDGNEFCAFTPAGDPA
jgi:hypothetical protein